MAKIISISMREDIAQAFNLLNVSASAVFAAAIEQLMQARSETAKENRNLKENMMAMQKRITKLYEFIERQGLSREYAGYENV